MATIQLLSGGGGTSASICRVGGNNVLILRRIAGRRDINRALKLCKIISMSYFKTIHTHQFIERSKNRSKHFRVWGETLRKLLTAHFLLLHRMPLATP